MVTFYLFDPNDSFLQCCPPRLDEQHRYITGILGGRLIVADGVDLEGGGRVLDAGTGTGASLSSHTPNHPRFLCIYLTGAWILDVAKEVGPKPELIGADLFSTMFPPADADWVPPNIHFLQASTLDLPKDWSGTFDLINQRFMIAAFTLDQWRTVVSEFYRVLKPGGKIQFIEVHGPTPADALAGKFDAKYCFHKFIAPFSHAVEKRGLAWDCAEKLPGILTDSGFEDVFYIDQRGPVGSSGGTQGRRGAKVLEPILDYGLKLQKEEVGLADEDAKRMKAEVLKEWDEVPGMYFELRAVFAAKPL